MTEAVNPELFRALEGRPTQPVTEETLLFWRQAAQPAPALPPPAPQLTAVDLPTEQAGRVRTYVVDPDPQGEGKPAVLDLHGGGFVLGTGDARPAYLQEIAMRTGAVVISPEYRLAPEHPFPAALEDCAAVLASVQRNASEYRIDPRRIAVSGGSAGGGHAAMLCLAERGRSLHPIAFQLLVQPMLDDRTGSTRPPPPHVGHLVWTEESNRFGWTSHLAQPPGAPETPAGAVPARETELAGLPPTWIGVGSLDLFVVEDLEYAARLTDAGVTAEVLVVPGAYHGFHLQAPHAELSRQFTAAYVAAFRRGLGLPPEVRETPPLCL